MPSSRRVAYTHEAEADLREILQYTRETWGERQRNAYATALDSAIVRLAAHPELGPARPALFPGCRIHRVQHHVIYYQIQGSGVLVIRVLHVRADASSQFVDQSEEPPP